MANIAVLDFEAQSASTSTGKIISVSGILYNDQFQELDRFELFCTYDDDESLEAHADQELGFTSMN